ncbi:MAG: imidazolonepropionase [Candidatus Thermoplasmatota archaeon]
MRAVFLNAGPLVHFAHERTSYENSIDGIGKAIIIEDDVIVSIKDSDEVVDEYSLNHDDVDAATADLAVHDLAGQSIVPGLIDGHTHLLWAGDRSREVSWRQAGKSYAEIADMGGGIRSTVESTRLAGDDELFALGYKRLREALRTGTTHLEAKSGYGLSTESELRLLQVASRLNGISHTPTIDSTWMGAHDTPPGTPREVYVETLLSEQLPAVVEQGIARSADVFCEPGWFTVEESEDILRASRKAGLALRMHVDEFVDGGGAELASALGVETADHAYHTPMEVRLDMKSNGVNTGFLPGTPYAMGDQWPDMADIVEHDVPFTLATDFNPNCQTLSLPLMCSLMVQRCGMNPLLALEAVTASAAKTTPHPSGRPHGVLKEGAVANFNIVDGPHWEAVCLRPSGSPFSATVLNGQFISH